MQQNYFLLLFLLAQLLVSEIRGQANIDVINTHLECIVKTDGYRNYQNLVALNQTAKYIFNHLQKYADTTYYQPFQVNGKTYKNVVSMFGPSNRPTIIVGAHYDVCGNQQGADDNATGIVGILELARLLKNTILNYNVQLVAYTLEEPPFFGTKMMGSFFHAKSLHDQKVDVYGMLSLDMIGYFSDQENSQTYPISSLSKVYGTKGDFILLVNKMGKGKFVSRFYKSFKEKCKIRVKSFTGPKWVTGVDWSDHRNYWKFGYSASMITDTAANRNRNYHRKTDTIETLDVAKMSQVINGIFNGLIELE